MVPAVCTLGPGFQAADILVTQLTQLAIKILASVTVIWLSFTELFQEIKKFRDLRLHEVQP